MIVIQIGKRVGASATANTTINRCGKQKAHNLSLLRLWAFTTTLPSEALYNFRLSYPFR